MAPLRSNAPSPRRIDTSTSSHTSSKQTIILREDGNSGLYKLDSIGVTVLSSAVNLEKWQPVDHLPPSVTGKAGVSQLTAWVKRSGQGLVIRLRNQKGKQQGVNWTDLRFKFIPQTESANWAAKRRSESPEHAKQAEPRELAGSEIIELGSTSPTSYYSPIAELCGASKPWNELEGSETPTELPTLHAWHEIATSEVNSLDSPTSSQHSEHSIERLSILPNPPQALKRSFSFDEYPDSDCDTRSTRLSLADTAVGSTGDLDSPTRQSMLSHGPFAPLARGLTLSSSITYRCDKHTDFESASPTEVVRKFGRAFGRRANPRVQQPGSTMPHQTPCTSTTSTTTSDSAKADIIAARQLTERSDVDIKGDHDAIIASLASLAPGYQTDVSKMMPLMMCGMTSSTAVYQQDLHIAKGVMRTHTIAAEIVGTAQTLTPQKLESLLRLAQLDNTARTLGQLGGLYSDVGESTIPHHVVMSTGRGRKDVDHNVERRLSFGRKMSLPVVTPRAQRLEDSSLPNGHQGNIGSFRLESAIKGGINASPISPLTVEERLRNPEAMASNYLPITPMTPTKPGSHSGSSNLGRSNSLPETITSTDGGEKTTVIRSPSHTLLNSNAQTDKDCESGSSTNAEDIEAFDDNDNGVLDAMTCSSLSHATGTMTKHLADYIDHKHSPAPFSADEKIPAIYKNTRFTGLPHINTTVSASTLPERLAEDVHDDTLISEERLRRTTIAMPRSRGLFQDTSSLLLAALADTASRCTTWLQRRSGQELPIVAGHVRVRWICNCGESLYDDFIEQRQGAASELERALNHELPLINTVPRSGSRSSQSSIPIYTPGNSGHPSSSSSAAPSSGHSAGFGTPSGNSGKSPILHARTWSYAESQPFPPQQPQFLLTCVNEARNTPKFTNVALHQRSIFSDHDLAIALRAHYGRINCQWYRFFRLRGLTSIEFVRFDAHQNRFADINKRPDVPPNDGAHDYDFDPTDLLPPVGSTYLLHLFKHPQEYEDEKIAYSSIPKKLAKLHKGVGWGIVLAEDVLPERLWLFVLFSLVLFGCVFAVVWTVKEHDIQGAFGVASFFTTLAAMTLGFVQAYLG